MASGARAHDGRHQSLPGAAAGSDGAGLAPGYRALAYPAPEPGTYELPPLGDAADGNVLDTDGRAHRLHELLDDKLTVLSLVYTTCPDVGGCPLATFVLGGVERRVREDETLRGDVRLISLSFDPERDQPEVMREYGRKVAREGADWLFLTTASKTELAPILEGYGQAIEGASDETISHLLRVFLIDRQGRVRNVYSPSFLHADTLVSDLRTLRIESHASEPARPAGPATGPAFEGPGDDRRGYDRDGYETRSRSLDARAGAAAELLAFAKHPPLGLPPLPVPDDNPLTIERIALGRKLFYDRRVSRNETISCAMCHIPEHGFTSNEIATAVGIEGRTVKRNAPTLYNVGYAGRLFHDGRESRLEQQVWGPLLAANEMGAPSVGYVLDKLASLPDYEGLFETAFDGRGATMETVGMALASYERTLVSGASRFDRWHFGGETGALSEPAKRGFELFTGAAGCASCHTIDQRHALLSDGQLHNTGVGVRQLRLRRQPHRRVPVAPGKTLTIDMSVVADAAERPPGDLGRYEVTEDPDDRWRYKTPTLRNVALTAPYMHDGSFPTLRAVVDYYDAGGTAHEQLDPRVRRLGLTDRDKDDLVALLESLTGDNVDVLVADALAAPIGERR